MFNKVPTTLTLQISINSLKQHITNNRIPKEYSKDLKLFRSFKEKLNKLELKSTRELLEIDS